MKLETLNRMLQTPEDMKYRNVYDKIRIDAMVGGMSCRFLELPENTTESIGHKYITDEIARHLRDDKGYTVTKAGNTYSVSGWEKAPHMRCPISGKYYVTRIAGGEDV